MRLILVVVLILLFSAATALAGKQVRYAGPHPVPKTEGGGFCEIEGPHVHLYAASKLEYRLHGKDNVFVGDPVAYGWDGAKHAYKGPHPIHVELIVGGDEDVEYCYLDGPHYHAFAPPPDPDFVLTGGAYFFIGEPPRAFVDARPTYVGINAVYRPMVYARPVITVEAPVGWIGTRVELTAPAVVAPTVRARAEVHVPPPGVQVHVVAPAIVIEPAVIVEPAPVIVMPHGKFKGRGRYKAKWK